MTKTKQEIYCSYINYLDDHYPLFKEYLERTCTKRSLRLPKDKGLSGITLLIPDNDEFTKAMEKSLAASSDADYAKSSDMMRACIIYGHLPKLADWKAQQDDIITSLLKKLPVKDVGASEVTLEGGCKIVPDDRFRQTEKSASKVAIWIIKSGIPKASNVDAEFKHAARKSVKGSAEVENNEPDAEIQMREVYMRTIMAAYECVITDAKCGKKVYRLPLLEYSASLISFIMHSDKYKQWLPDAMSVCNMGFSDIIFLLEPSYCGTKLLPDELINSWWDHRKTAPIKATYEQAFADVMPTAACFSQRNKITHELNHIRKNRPVGLDTFQDLYGYYQSLSKDNSLFEVHNIFPERVAKRYRENPVLKLNEDDRRFYWEIRFMNFEKDFGPIDKDLKEILDSILLFCQQKDSLTRLSTIVLNSEKVRKHLAGALETVIMPIYFSNLILYMPGYEPLPEHATSLEKNQLFDYYDYNRINIDMIEKTYAVGSRTEAENMHEMDKAALHLFSTRLKHHLSDDRMMVRSRPIARL